jgi:hypothetical protein
MASTPHASMRALRHIPISIGNCGGDVAIKLQCIDGFEDLSR